ncbi:hypothetical protein OS493_030651 [Desmophyllum pertusum]|uniref:Secreted protein n=1 Tax=Desmophyllum pertusum TaxID=174260 RepID=A0A9W9ZKJ1_9CNID|nr:hypothetical protein OS493_030651 [Desmophyllum pertusum]
MHTLTFLLLLMVQSGWTDQQCNTTSNTSVVPTTSLPPECYRPSGDSCDWYRNCLEKKYHCEASSNDYAIDMLRNLRDHQGDFHQAKYSRESLKGMWNIITACDLLKIRQFKECVKQNVKGVIKFFKLKIQKFKDTFKRERRSTDPLPEADAQSRFADGVGSAIASTLKWNTDVMDWLAYTGRFHDLNDMEIIIVLADKKALGIVTTPVPSVDFNQTIQEFASAVEKGKLRLQVDGYKVWVKSLASCSDKSCNDTQTLAVSDKPPKWNGAAGISHGNVGLCGAIAVLIVLMDKLFY